MSEIELFRDAPLELDSTVAAEQVEGAIVHLREAISIAFEAIREGRSPLKEVVGICRGCGNDADVNAALIFHGNIITSHAKCRYPWFDPTPVIELLDLIRLWDYGEWDPEVQAGFYRTIPAVVAALSRLWWASHLERCAGCRKDYGFSESPSPKAIDAAFRVLKKKKRAAPLSLSFTGITKHRS